MTNQASSTRDDVVAVLDATNLSNESVRDVGVDEAAQVAGGVFRITNIRANAAGLGGGGLAGTTQLAAS